MRQPLIFLVCTWVSDESTAGGVCALIAGKFRYGRRTRKRKSTRKTAVSRALGCVKLIFNNMVVRR